MVNKYDLDTLHHVLELKHKSIVKKENITKEGLSSKLIKPLTYDSYLEITKKTMIYVLETKDRDSEILRINILEKSKLEYLSNARINKILIKLKIKKRVEQSHNFYCKFCDSWIYSNDYESLETVHNIKQHLPLEVDWGLIRIRIN